MEKKNMNRTLVGITERVRKLRNVEETDVKMDCKDMMCETVERIKLARDRIQWGSLVNSLIHFRVS
jgi:hypothetical protein